MKDLIQITIWAVIDNEKEVIGAYTNRVSAARRVEYLNETMKRFAPYDMVRCTANLPTP